MLLDIYAKNEKENLTADEIKQLKNQMKPRTVKAIIRSKEKIERGETAPARVFELKPDGKGGFTRRDLNPKEFQRSQKEKWQNNIAATRGKLGLSQSQFARLLGISIKTLQHWEHGLRTPSGAARVLLKIAAEHPDLVLQAA